VATEDTSGELCGAASKMNRAFYIIAIPAFVTSFCWLTFGWGWRFASMVTGVALIIAIAAVIYLLRRENAQKNGAETGR
jgi:amino acid permease